MEQGNLPHIFWIDIDNNGVYVECAVMKRDPLGNVSYFPLKTLDDIDKRRLHRILLNRNAEAFELWDLMSNITLNNGVNALDYFHQLVIVLTPSGQKMRPQQGVIGVGDSGTIDTRNKDDRAAMEDAANVAATAAAQAAAAAAAAAIQNMQNPQAPAAAAALQEAAPAPAPKKRTSRAKPKAAE